MKKILIATLLLVMMVAFMVPVFQCEDQFPNELRDFYLDNYYQDTGAENAVTAIYLNYRVFDTMFEALMLLISVLGVIYLSKIKGEYLTHG